MDQLLKSAKTSQVLYVPGEHDTSVDDGKQYLEGDMTTNRRRSCVNSQNDYISFTTNTVPHASLVNENNYLTLAL